MKNSNVEWIGQIPDDWKIVRLKDYWQSKKEIVGNKVNQFERIALTLNGVIKRSKDDSDGLQPKDFETYQIIEENDFIFKMIDLQNINTSRVGLSPYTGLVSPAYIRFSPKNKNQFTQFMYYYLMSLYYNCVYNSLCGDGVRSSLSAIDMGNIFCPYPSTEKQKIIVDYLNKKCSEIDQLIEVENQQIEKLKEYKQAIITEAVTKGLDKNVKLKESGVEWIGKIPENWEIIPLKTVFTFGKGLPITKENLVSRGIKVISYGQIHSKMNKSVGIDDSMYRYVSDEYLNTNIESIVKYGDFIFADTSEDVEGTGDFIHIDNNETIFAGYHTIILFNYLKRYSNYFAYLFMTDAWRNQFRSKVNGVKLFSITKKLLSQGLLLCPSLEQQKLIVQFLNNKLKSISKIINIKMIKIENLQQYKKSMIYEYVTGKKEVK